MDEAIERAGDARGPWPTAQSALLALAPLVVGVAVMVAADRKTTLGPLGPSQLVYWVVVPLALIYPTIAALARRMAYAPMTVLVTAAVAPSLIYAMWKLLEPLPKDALGRNAVTPQLVAEIALPPAILGVGAFIAIEVVTAAIRRGVAVGAFGAIAGAAIFAASFLAPFLGFGGLLPAR